MDAFVSRKRRRISSPSDVKRLAVAGATKEETEDESTDFKLAILASIHPYLDQVVLLESLLANDGSVEEASQFLENTSAVSSPKKKSVGYQSSLQSFALPKQGSEMRKPRLLSRKGKTLYLYSPGDVEQHTPCSIIHNFLPADQADALLRELLEEAPTFQKDTFKLFDRVVESPHTMCFYVDSWDEAEKQKNDYVYNGARIKDVRPTLPEMRKAAALVQESVNDEVQRRIQNFYPNGLKLKYQSPNPWVPNASFVNCYAGGAESVGYHSDQLTYLGPRAIIGSLSLGVAREFRVRRVVPRPNESGKEEEESNEPSKTASLKRGETRDQQKVDDARADAEGQISIHLPHNSLLVMHAEMQEEWKHSIAPAAAIDPHPLAGNKRINITYRCYKDSLNPSLTPKCKCGVPTVLRCVQRKEENRGRYMWMCHVNYTPGGEGCSYFKWAEFDEDGEPPWAKGK